MELEYIRKIIKNREKGSVGNCSFFSVMIPLVEIEGEIHVLYQIRAKTLKRQPGEISFPGGKVEAEESPRETAIRETCEELCIEEGDIELLAEFDTLYGSTNFVMYSFVGIISEETYKNMKPSTDEVDEVFLVSLEYLMNNEPALYDFEVFSRPVTDKIHHHKGINTGYSWGKAFNETPVYPIGDTPIWGITGRVTREFIKVIKKEKI